MIGVPEEDHGKIVEWSWGIFGRDGSPEATARWARRLEAIVSYGSTLISSRRAQPSDDITTLLLSAEVDDQPLTDGVMQMWFLTLTQAGYETTHTLMSQGMLLLDEIPDLRA